MYTLCDENKPLFFCPPRACLGAKAVVISTDAWIQAKRKGLSRLFPRNLLR